MLDPQEVLVERSRAGDGRAFEELVRLHSDIAFRSAYLAVGNAADAEEVAQEAFIKAFRGLPGFRAGSPFRPWLLRIVANEASNRRRSAGRRLHLETRILHEAFTDNSATSPDALLEAAESRRRLQVAVDRLSAEDRAVIHNRYLLGLSVGETANLLDCAEGTVKSRLSRALGRLRAGMAADG